MVSLKCFMTLAFITLLSMTHYCAAAERTLSRFAFLEKYEQAIPKRLVDVKHNEGTEGDFSGQGKVTITPEDANYKLSYENYDMTWRNFKKEHDRNYESATEEKKRFAIFMDNVKLIERHNWRFHNGLTTYWMDINKFSDWTKEEMTALTPVLDPTINAKWGVPYNGTHQFGHDLKVPEFLNWTAKGYVTPVKDQTGSVESHWYAKSGQLVSLSEQQLVDCSGDYLNFGCIGGLTTSSYKYIKDAGGQQSEKSYPYVAKEGPCRFNKSEAVAKLSGYKNVPKDDENALKMTVATVGPVTSLLFATPNFQHYRGGIFFDDTCGGEQINHSMVVVGYGSVNKTDYWIIKNSWGTSWGDRGYVLLARNRGSMCAVATYATYPLV